ncbi:hypothetical protein Moror_12293 [Moniliophthora roreri MCA 2997]|uniref:Uncharacterized protein n=1 Tax=Moniliophthora roreri (strain MCA 2997) TaxID=1381753 RepID=V2XTP9_MONRO|nr:hypothetical protein Moror_12293 [Moniliophthora roreri MCA 2997]
MTSNQQSTSSQRVFSDEVAHSGPFHPSAFDLLYLLNSEHYDAQLTVAVQDNDQQQALLSSLMFLRGHHRMLNKVLACLDQEAGVFVNAMTEGEDRIQLMGPATVPMPVLDVENLPLHVEIPETDTIYAFPTDADISPNEPAFFTEYLLERRQQLCRLASNNRTSTKNDPTTNSRGNDPSIANQNLPLIYPPTTDDNQTGDRTSHSDSSISNATERAQLFPNISPPSTLPPMSRNPFTRTNAVTNPDSSSHDIFERARLSPISPPLIYPTTQTQADPIVSVWDVEDNEMDDRASLQEPRSRPHMPHIMGQMEGVFEALNVLCAEW